MSANGFVRYIGLLLILTEAAHQIPYNQSRLLVPAEILLCIVDFCINPDVCALSQVTKFHQQSVSEKIQIRKEQKEARHKMKTLWNDIRGHETWDEIFGYRPIHKTSPEVAIQHLIHQMDGRTTLLYLDNIGKRFAADYPHGVPSGRPLSRKIEEYQRRWLIGGHPIHDPPHRYERVRCGISNAKMSLFDEYIALFAEMRAADSKCKEMRSEKSTILAWQRVMEIIGARIGYPNMAFCDRRDLMDENEAFGAVCNRVMTHWARTSNVEDTIKRFNAFHKKAEEMIADKVI